MTTNMALNIALVFPLAHAGLALATTLSASLNALLLFRGLRREAVYRPPAGWGWLGGRAALACAVMGALLWWGAGPLSTWTSAAPWDRVGWLAGWVAAGGLAYGATLLLLGVRPRHLREAS